MSGADSDRWKDGRDLDSMPEIEAVDGDAIIPSPAAPPGLPHDAAPPDLDDPDDDLITAIASPSSPLPTASVEPATPDESDVEEDSGGLATDSDSPAAGSQPPNVPMSDPFSKHIRAPDDSDGSAARQQTAATEEPMGSVRPSEPAASAVSREVGPETGETDELASVVPISRAMSAPAQTRDEGLTLATEDLSEDFKRLISEMSDDELDRALEFFESRVDAGYGSGVDDDDDFPHDMLLPLGAALAARGDVEAVYSVEEIEDLLDARLPDAARVDPTWWSNRPGMADAGYAAYWRDSGWWAYPELEGKRVRFRRTL